MRAGRVDLDVVAERCRELGLQQTAEQLPELLEEASREDLTPVRFLERLVEREYERKEERRIGMWLRMSGLPPGKTLDSFDWTFQPRADRAKVEELATCEFARRAENVLFLGPPGVGKTHLATGLGGEGDQERVPGPPLRARRPDPDDASGGGSSAVSPPAAALPDELGV